MKIEFQSKRGHCLGKVETSGTELKVDQCVPRKGDLVDLYTHEDFSEDKGDGRWTVKSVEYEYSRESRDRDFEPPRVTVVLRRLMDIDDEDLD